MKKKLVIGIIVTLLALTGIGYAIGDYFVNYALSPVSDSVNREINEEDKINIKEDAQNIIKSNQTKEMKKGAPWWHDWRRIGSRGRESCVVYASVRGNRRIMELCIIYKIKLKAKYKIQKKQTNKWVVLIHGYKSNNDNMMSYAEKYYKEGYNVLLPNNRAHGNSEGEYIGMCCLDKEDISCCIYLIVKNDPKSKRILHGVSMGGATTMMTSGDNLDNVVGYIEDCGYTSVWDIFESELDKRFSLPAFPILNISSTVANLKAGYDFTEASSLEQVKKCKKPMLFIHGGKDDFVPTDMVYEVYNVANCKKDLYIVEQAGHAEAKDYDPDAYWDKVFNFINENIEI